MSLLDKASLILTPNAYKASKLYSIIPSDGDGDMTVVRNTSATRDNSSGLVELVGNNIPRLEYDGSCPSILLEPQRTALLTYSEMFSDVSWVKTNSTISANVTTSPDGALTADRYSANGVNTAHQLTQSITFTSGSTYTFSTYAKVDTNNFIQLVLPAPAFGANAWANFNVLNGTIGTVGSAATTNIVNVGNGWFRCSITAPATTTILTTVLLVVISSATSGRLEANTLTTSLFIWGAQLEVGAYITSYIPTTTSTVTRNLDAISKTGISDLIGQTEGVLFVESAALFNDLTSRILSISDGTSMNRIGIYYNTNSNQILIFGVANGTSFANSISYTLTDETQFAKIAVRYRVNDITLWVNGAKRGTDITSQALPLSMSRLGFDAGNSTTQFYSKVKQVQLYKTYLTNTEMQSLTTL